MVLDVRRLTLLAELSRRGTIAEVARVVGYTPSAVSQSLAQLEREIGVALLERDGRRVRLTPAAIGLVARADRVLAELDAAAAELAAEQGTVRGSIEIGAFPSAAGRLVVPALHDLRAGHAELECTVREHEPEDGIPLLRSGALDVLISERYDDVTPAPVGGLEEHLLLSEPLLLVLPEDHPSGDPVDLGTLADAPWIGGLAGTQYAVAMDRACRAAGFAPRFVHTADEASVHHALAAAGLGVGLLPALACPGADGVRYARATPAPPRRHVSALVRRGAERRPAVAAVLDALRHSVQRLRPVAAYAQAPAVGQARPSHIPVLQHPRPCHVSTPSLTAMQAISRPTAGSSHQAPASALPSRPASSAPAR
jgi:DNA-binding transcriptional LysR family regulator